MFTTAQSLTKYVGKPIVICLNGMEFIGNLKEVYKNNGQEDAFTLSKVRQVRIIPHPQNPKAVNVDMSMPLSFFQQDEDHDFLITQASLIYSPTNDMEKGYLQQTSGIQLA